MWCQVNDICASRVVRRWTEEPNRLRDAAALLEKSPAMAHNLDVRGLVEWLGGLRKVAAGAEGEAEDLREEL
jgi:hypothetical protein